MMNRRARDPELNFELNIFWWNCSCRFISAKLWTCTFINNGCRVILIAKVLLSRIERNQWAIGKSRPRSLALGQAISSMRVTKTKAKSLVQVPQTINEKYKTGKCDCTKYLQWLSWLETEKQKNKLGIQKNNFARVKPFFNNTDFLFQKVSIGYGVRRTIHGVQTRIPFY